MDTLGKFGWELVGIVGAIGGDQEMVFRRPYDPEQSKAEAALIKEEGERLLALQRNIARQTVEADFVDLDALERENAIAETRRKEEARLKTAIESLSDPNIIEIKVASTAQTPSASAVFAEIIVDGSQLLKEGNKYHSSAARALAKQVAGRIYAAAGLTSRYAAQDLTFLSYSAGEVKLDVSVRLSYQGKQKVVATENIGGNWPERR